ncbi:hypothetical protein AB1Y20_016452 [Prymnesium parvum]|uniref:NAD(P)(+)--arginine ADP-ribosyltransferase n=1 Tax=Prymnesium parvum TaxID=97485 RepID=A0AB34IET0_PRYPA
MSGLLVEAHREALEDSITAALNHAIATDADDPIGSVAAYLTDLSRASRASAAASHAFSSLSTDGALPLDRLPAACALLSPDAALPAARVRYLAARFSPGGAPLLLQHFTQLATYLEATAAAHGELTAAWGEGGGGGGGGGEAPHEPADDAADEWSASSWLASHGVGGALAAALLPGGSRGAAAIASLRALGGGKEAAAAALARCGALDVLAELLGRAIASLDAPAAGGEGGEGGGAGKFTPEGFELEYGALDAFFRGLEGVVGTPSPRVLHEMRAEHTARADADAPFSSDNYSVLTSSRVEWYFVAAPHEGLAACALEEYPKERGGVAASASPRVPTPLDDFVAPLEERNAKLREMGQPEIIREEALAARLYTGPTFVKYNAVLRGLQSHAPRFRARFAELCLGNKYTTTLHAINSAVVKLSKLTLATRVYRGVCGGRLPEALRVPNAFGVRGGVDLAFLSTTTDRAVAVHYATSRAGPALTLELRQGMVDRGADISWLSQYPHEREVLFPPLTGCEVLALRAEGALLVAEVSPSVNLTAATLEQVIERRRKLLLQMRDAMATELAGALAGGGGEAAAEACFAAELGPQLDGEAAAFNDDEAFMQAVTRVVHAKAAALCRGLRAAGEDAAALLRRGFSAAQCKAAGCAAAEMKAAGLRALEVAALGYSAAELREAGCTPPELAALRLDEIRGGGYAARALREAGRLASELREAGYAWGELLAAGYPPLELRGAGATVADMRAANVDAMQMHAAGYSAREFRQAFYDPARLIIEAGFAKEELIAAGYPETQLRHLIGPPGMHQAQRVQNNLRAQQQAMHEFRS